MKKYSILVFSLKSFTSRILELNNFFLDCYFMVFVPEFLFQTKQPSLKIHFPAPVNTLQTSNQLFFLLCEIPHMILIPFQSRMSKILETFKPVFLMPSLFGDIWKVIFEGPSNLVREILLKFSLLGSVWKARFHPTIGKWDKFLDFYRLMLLFSGLESILEEAW